MAAILRDSTGAVVRTCPRAIPLTRITLRKSTQVFFSFLVFFAFLSEYGAPPGGPSNNRSSAVRNIACVNFFGSVQKINPLDSQSKFQTFTLLIGGPRRSSKMAQFPVQVYYFTALFTEKLINIVHRNAQVKKIQTEISWRKTMFNRVQ